MTSEETSEPAEADHPVSPAPSEVSADIEQAASPVRRASLTYKLGRGVINPLARLIYRPRIEGKDNVPRTGPVIFASNHLSFIDSIAIPVAAPRPVHFLAKASYFDGTGFSGWISREFFTSIGAIAVERGAGQAALDALDQQRQLLEEGSAVALYPEGTRSLDGRLYKGRTGVAFLALQTGAPIVPVGLIGTDAAMPVGAKLPSLRARITVKFGEPIDVTRHGAANSGRARRLATDEIMAAIHALSGQELAGAYNEPPAHTPIERIKQVLPHERL
ncbi:lysophospholipid acyltransferase family protein [Microbacterium terricola]|uniref:1-acyl-sn-glycerol-3-phosphate acyltransferase n=1 Tax=Microbacterium terricola TaxID=344163 RepID=A0ABM8DX32_9MICO|nr:1-acyl-sn-glycerol-3-phosphate acyltransferase [Microbacterium terricola]